VFDIRGVQWEVVAAPTQAFADAVRPGAVMLAGLISLALSVLSAAALLGLQFARRAAASSRAANEGLLVSEARYDLTVKGLSVGVWDWDLTDGSLYLSNQVKTMVGANDSGPDNRIDFFFERLYPDDAERVRDALTTHFEDGVPYRCEFRFRHESGRYIWCLATGQAIWDEAGEPLRMAGSVQDVTAEHIAEDLRRLSEERLRAVIENASDVVLITDIRGVITEANPACREVFGYAPEALIGQNARMLAPEELHDFQALRLNDQLRRRERGRLAGRQEFSGRKRDGTVFPVEFSVTASRAGQAPIFIAIARDLTASKAVEAEREAFIEKLETANAELERFSYAASHDLREPLRMVASFSQLLLQQHAEKLDGSALRALEICASSARRMQALLDDLLAFSRSGSDLGRIEACAPADLIGTALDHLDEAIEKSGAQIQIGEMPDTMRVNPLRFIRVFQNLVGNAVKYTPEGEAPKISLHAAPSQAGYVFTVADQGIGMNPDYAEKIFEPFTRLNPSSKFDGTGMGLAICRKIVANAGGRIWVETALGEGSRFHVYWPLTEADDATDNAEDDDNYERAAS
jgi:PAS domain S-box-containing protein